jgi:hypothetical protein
MFLITIFILFTYKKWSYCKMYLGFCIYLHIVRPTDQKKTAIKEMVCCLQFPRGGAYHAM